MKITKKLTKLKLYILLYWNMMFQKQEETANYIYENDYINNEKKFIDTSDGDYIIDEENSSSR